MAEYFSFDVFLSHSAKDKAVRNPDTFGHHKTRGKLWRGKEGGKIDFSTPCRRLSEVAEKKTRHALPVMLELAVYSSPDGAPSEARQLRADLSL